MPLLPPETTLRFTVLGELAMGGMGRVDLARVAEGATAGRLVALKRLHPHMARDPHFIEMFLDEVWLTAALRHPNVVEVVGWGRDDDGVFLAMELVAGTSLQHLARAGRAAGEAMPPELVAHVGAEIAAGLGAAHALTGPDGAPLGVVHRDVTPSNVLVGLDGAVKLTDFGVANAEGKSSHTKTGILKGKVAYIAPEYARARWYDHRADLYALGVVLYELASGRRPFSAPSDVELLRVVIEAEPAPIDDVDPALRALVLRLLAKDPATRPQTAADVRRELEALLAARGVDRGAATRALVAYVDRHARDRRAQLAALAGEQALPSPDARVAAPATVSPEPGSSPGAGAARAAADPSGMDAFADSVVGAAHTRSDVTRGPLSGGRLVVVAAGTFACVLVVLAVVIAVGARRGEPPAHAAATAAPHVPQPVVAASVAALVTATSAAPIASASASSEAVSAPAPSALAASSAEAPAASAPAAVASAAPVTTARAVTSAPAGGFAHAGAKRAAPKRSCTPTDFDYPACLDAK